MEILRKLFLAVALIFIATSSYSQTLKKGNIVAVHEWKIALKNNTSQYQFEKFILQEYIPAFEKNCPELQVFLMKGDRGKNAGEYALMIHFNTLESRNDVFPTPGHQSEKYKDAFERLKPIFDKFNEMAAFETFYTDWMVL